MEDEGLSSISIEKDIELALTEKNFCDVVFVIENQKYKIEANAVIVFNRCPELIKYRQKEGVIELEEIKLNVLSHLLFFLYADNLDPEEMSNSDLVDLRNISSKLSLARLVFFCDFFLNKDSNQTVQKNAPLSSIQTDYLSSVDNSMFSDITIVLDDNSTIFAHRIILVCRSQYFRAALLGNMKESTQNQFPLHGEFQKEHVLKCLHYIYGNMNIFEDLNPDLSVKKKNLLITFF